MRFDLNFSRRSSIAKKWIPELRHYASGVPTNLFGTKLDLRDDKQFFIDHPGAVPTSTNQVHSLLNGLKCSSKTQQRLNRRRDDLNLALSYLAELKQHGVSPNVNAYATLVKILSSCGLDRKLDSVLVELIKNEHRGFSVFDLIAVIGEESEEDKRSLLLLIRVSAALVKAYASLGMFDEAIDVMFQCKRSGCVPDIKAYNFLMNRLIDFGKIDTVVALFRQHKELGLYANEYTYAIVVKALCRKGDFEGAGMLLVKTLSVFAFTTFIEGLCLNGKTDKAVVVIESFIDLKPLAVDDLRTAYIMVVRGFCNEMLCSILQCHCKMGKCLEALQKFKEFRDMDIFLDRVCYNVAFHAFSKLGRVEEAIQLLQEMRNKGLAPDVINYTTLIDGYCLQGKVDDALDLMDEMRRNGVSPDAITYDVLASGLARNGDTKEALNIYNVMKVEGLKPNAVTHSVIIEGLCFAGELEAAEKFFNSLDEKCPENYGSLVKGYCESGHPIEAYKLFYGLEFPLCKSVYIKLFTSLIKDYHEKAHVVLKRMWEYRVEPGKSMCGKMIETLCESKSINMREAQKIFDTMVERGLIPDMYTYTIMIHTYCKLNELQKADHLFGDMKQRGIKPDVATYSVLLDNYLRLDPEHNITSEVWREFKAAGIERDSVFYKVLIKRQCKIHNLEDAIKLFYQMITSGLEPEEVVYRALICGHCRNGYINKAVTLVTKLTKKDILPT